MKMIKLKGHSLNRVAVAINHLPQNGTVLEFAHLLINGEEVAQAHVNNLSDDKSADEIFMQLSYIPADMQTTGVAAIIADFAIWLRFDWETSDKEVSELPALVRLRGYELNRPEDGKIYEFTALWDATKIQKEHLRYEFATEEAC